MDAAPRSVRAVPFTPLEAPPDGSRMERPDTPHAALMRSVTELVLRAREDGAGEARMRLNPPELGSVRVHLVERDDRVRIVFEVRHASVRESLLANQSQLVQQLRDQGLSVTEFGVSLGAEGDAQTNDPRSTRTRGGASARETPSPEAEESADPGSTTRVTSDHVDVIA